MKGKKLLALTSILAGVALVGTTFAKWAVTDNADPFGVRVTPGTLDVSGTGSVTLDWGETRTLADISGFGMGETAHRTVGVKATLSNAGTTTTMEGKLSVAMTTTSTATNKLIDYLTVKVYQKDAYDAISGDDKSQSLRLSLPYEVSSVKHYDGSFNETVTQDECVFYVDITMAAGLNPTLYNAIKNDIVTITLDWGIGDHVEIETTTPYYFLNTHNWTNVYAFAWNYASGAANSDYPGVLMTNVTGNIYSVELESGYDRIIFNDGTPGSQNPVVGTNKTADLTIDTTNRYYNGSSWTTVPSLTETDYYLYGTMNEWTQNNAYKLSPDTSKAGYTYSIKNVECAAGAELKIVSSTGVWYGEHGTVNQGNMSIGLAGHYDFYFNPNGNGAQENPAWIFCEASA